MKETIDNIITYLKVEAVQDQGEVVVKTVQDFQELATATRSENAKLVGAVQNVVETLDEAKRLFAVAFSKIPCAAIPACIAIQVSLLVDF